MSNISIETINGCSQGTRSSQKEIYEKMFPKMFPICLRYSENKDDAMDLLHDSFIKLFTCIGKYKNEGSFEGWVRRIFVNKAIDTYRANKKNIQKIQYSSDILYNSTYAEDDSDDTLVMYKDITPAIIMAELNEVPLAYRTAFNMYVIDEYTHKEIAKLLGIAEGTSKSNLHKARLSLRKKLNKYKINEN